MNPAHIYSGSDGAVSCGSIHVVPPIFINLIFLQLSDNNKWIISPMIQCCFREMLEAESLLTDGSL